MNPETDKQLEKRTTEGKHEEVPLLKKPASDTSVALGLLTAENTSIAAVNKFEDFLRWPIERPASNVNQKFLDTIIATGEGGFEAPNEQLTPTLRVFEIKLDTIRDCFKDVLNQVLLIKFIERGNRSVTAATTLALKVSTLCSDMCMSALYVKLWNVHGNIGLYKGRFTSSPLYTKEIELPLPFALAIKNMGLFQTSAMTTRYSVLPVYPANNKNEGRSKDDLDALGYQSYCFLFANIGLPMKNIDPSERKGTAWWTYCPSFNGDSYDLKIPYPPLHYSDHYVVLAAMFLSHNKEHAVQPIVTPPAEDADYGWHLKDIRPVNNTAHLLL